ncbi:MAG: HEAT repeat domain-containing protein [Candidatus Omnitrophota bacterium]|nr:HEAT repeat domain-containing protein [Candidatus Omnitrophota bacterium]MDZ4242715.1 HEAT repeat domain-containing protein [Candidatus Omnitrophota bacterium]
MRSISIFFLMVLCLSLVTDGRVFAKSSEEELSPEAVAQRQKEDEERIKKIFVTVESIARLPYEQQQGEEVYLYQEAYPLLKDRDYALIPGSFAPENAAQLSPEELASMIMARDANGIYGLKEAARGKCLELLKKHRQLVVPMIWADLENDEYWNRDRGLSLTAELAVTEMILKVLKILKESRDDHEIRQAVYALERLGDFSVIENLINKYPEKPLEFFETMRSLSKGHPPHPAVLKLLSSEDEEQRWKAVYVLAESGDAALIPVFQDLMRDPSAKVREQAVVMGYMILKKDRPDVRPSLVAVLSDPARDVRYYAAILLAEIKDKACAPVLLELLKDGSMEEWRHSNVVQAVNNLTGSYFGYYNGSDGWQPTTEQNQKAIAAFAKWIEDNPHE